MRNLVRTSILPMADVVARRTRFRLRGRGSSRVPRRDDAQDVDSLVSQHFCNIGELQHPSRGTLHHALRLLDGRPAQILETGTAAWGTKSTILFASYVETFGGKVMTIDTRLEPALATFRTVPNSVSYLIGDSARVLKRPDAREFASSADLVYLDSWDVDAEDPYASAVHGVAEFIAIADRLKRGAMVLIDDTPVSRDSWSEELPSMVAFSRAWGVPMGKGSLVRKLVEGSPGFEVLMHEYQLLLRKV